MTAMQHAFVVLFLWAAARRNPHIVYGPRFAFYTAIVPMDDGLPALDVTASLREDCNAIDALCRLALDEYDDWRTGRDGGLRVFVDGEARPVDGDGSFDPRGTMVLVRDGRCATRVRAGERLPFKDARLA
jgi:hypothetical protein